MTITAGDRILYEALCEAAAIGATCPSTDDLVEIMGCESSSTPADSLRRLEMAALIRVRRYQRARVVTITANGLSTAEPDRPQPHWRDRPMGMAASALKLADKAMPGASAIIRAESERRGKPVPDMIGEIMRRGLKSIQREMAKG